MRTVATSISGARSRRKNHAAAPITSTTATATAIRRPGARLGSRRARSSILRADRSGPLVRPDVTSDMAPCSILLAEGFEDTATTEEGAPLEV
jgi:hypothetical protein